MQVPIAHLLVMCFSSSLIVALPPVKAENRTEEAAELRARAKADLRARINRTVIVKLKEVNGQLQRYEAEAEVKETKVHNQACDLSEFKLPSIDFEVLESSNPECNAQELCEAMLASGRVESCEPDLEVEWLQGFRPSDPLYDQQYGLHQIDIGEAWEFEPPNHDTLVGLFDSGSNLNHPDLKSTLWRNPGEIPGNQRDDDGNGYVDDVHGWDFGRATGYPEDTEGHGTSCHGVITATTNNHLGIAGTSRGAKVVLLKGGLHSSAILQAFEYMLQNNIKISSNSWGYGATWSEAMNQMMNKLHAAGHIAVFAAGNSAENNDNPATRQYPCAFNHPNVLCVAASDESGGRAYFSNYGVKTVDVAAPGSNIKTTSMSGGYHGQWGTSFACPMVAGVAALLWGYRPTATHLEIIDAIEKGVDVLNAFQGSIKTGGRINAKKSLDLLSRKKPQYALGGAGTNTCPTGYSYILDRATCIAAGAALQDSKDCTSYQGGHAGANQYVGCIKNIRNKCIHFNKDNLNPSKNTWRDSISQYVCSRDNSPGPNTGGYALGVVGTNTCPTGYAYILDRATCIAAGAALQDSKDCTSYQGGHAGANQYVGCIKNIRNKCIHFNKDNLNPSKNTWRNSISQYMCVKRPAPPTSCAPSACREDWGQGVMFDNDCCAMPGTGSCQSGFTYHAQGPCQHNKWAVSTCCQPAAALGSYFNSVPGEKNIDILQVLSSCFKRIVPLLPIAVILALHSQA